MTRSPLEHHGTARGKLLLAGTVLATLRKPAGGAGGLVVVVLIGAAILAPLLTPYDPLQSSVKDILKQPSAQNWLGTDNFGRDVFSRIIFGARISLLVSLSAVALSCVFGITTGLASGYWGKKVDTILQRGMDSIMSIPVIVLTMTVVAMLGTSTANVIVAIGLSFMPSVSRIVRGSTLATKENQYTEAARAIGASDVRIIVLHILPNVMSPIIVVATIMMGQAILIEATLSFLGVGVQPPTPSWGGMLSIEGRQFMLRAPWIAVFPGLAISLVIFGFNLLGDALRDVLDPRLRGTGYLKGP